MAHYAAYSRAAKNVKRKPVTEYTADRVFAVACAVYRTNGGYFKVSDYDKDGNVIATSIRTKLEKPSKHGVKALHAEVSAIREAEAIGFTDWANATMYVTIDSCYTCSRTITEFYPFKRVVYGVEDPTLADYSRNKEGYANNGIALVECNNKAIQQEIRTLFNTIFQSEPRDTPLRRVFIGKKFLANK